MATPAQAAAATVGAGSLAAAGAYGITQAVNGGGEETNTEEQETTNENNEMPNEISVFADTDVSTEPYSNKLISFIKQANLSSLVKPSDEKWWDWAFKNKYPKLSKDKQSHQLFQSVTSSETLKTACDSAYKAEKTDYSFEANHHLLQNISDYCTKTTNSIDISEPKVTTFSGDQAATYANKLPSVDVNKPKLVKPEEATNDLWWKWAFKNLYGKKTGTQSTTFTTVASGYNASEGTSLNKICDAAYKKDYWDLKQSNWQLLKEIKQFCSVDTSETQLTPADPASPTLLTSDSGYTVASSLAKTNSNYTKLVDPDQETNKSWWEWTFDKHYPKQTEEIAKLNAIFENITSGYSNSGSTSLNQACKTSYSKVKDDFSNKSDGKTPLLDWVKKFCTKEGTASQITAPA